MKKFAKKITCQVLSISLLLSSASWGDTKLWADENYSVRDMWGYCETANYVTSEHFCIFYGDNDTTGHVNDEFLQRNLSDLENLWDYYMNELEMISPNTDMYGKSDKLYKTNIYLTHTGLEAYPEGWAFMSSEEGYGIEIISPAAMLDDLTIAHEFGHVVTMHQKAWVDQDITGAWWECVANWFREMYLQSDNYKGTVQTCGFEPYMRNLSLTLPHGRNYYEVWPFLVYMSENPDNLEGLGKDSVKRIMSEALPGEYPFDTMTRIFGTDAQTILGNYAKRVPTFDFGNQDAYYGEVKKKLKSSPYFYNLIYTIPEKSPDGWYNVPMEDAPMQSGMNIVPLLVTDKNISVSLKGISDDKNAGWRACIVTVDTAGNERYSELFGADDTMTVSSENIETAYLTVTATPKKFYPVNAFHKESDSSYKYGTERCRYPYAVKITGADINYFNGYSKNVKGHIHKNGGGFVADTAKVDDTVYVSENAMVLGNAVLSGNVRVEDYAVVANDVKASDNVIISGHAIVDGGGMIYDNGWKYGSVVLSENAVISDSAVVTNSCTVSGSAHVVQKAYLADAVNVSENAIVKGMAYLYGKGNYSGQVIVDGDYANEEKLDKGTAFGWLDKSGDKYTDGMIAGYDFAENTNVWANDEYAATNALIYGARWQEERTSANGVLSFDGFDDFLLIDDSVVRNENLQISFSTLWNGGVNNQALFFFGDENASMSFTPSNIEGKAEFTIKNKEKSYSLTSNISLDTGKWSKVTVRLLDKKGTLIINGKEVDFESIDITPTDVLSESKEDFCFVGKGDSKNAYSGAVDYFNFYFHDTNEPSLIYSGEEKVSLKGDVNADKKINISDLVMLKKYMLCGDTLTAGDMADINEDKKISVIDFVMLKNMLTE
ncbi:MAG: N-acetylglucosamine-1-phosphate uridyltransferase [Ruminococcus sp.]|nr:N-acetylglucosamine-1-phosphate uridyltransferase [Ruminococcus sp.]